VGHKPIEKKAGEDLEKVGGGQQKEKK